MKKKTAASKTYVKDENPELRKVVLRLRSFVKQIVPKTKITLNSWGIPTFEANQSFCFYMVGKRHITFDFHNGTSPLSSPIPEPAPAFPPDLLDPPVPLGNLPFCCPLKSQIHTLLSLPPLANTAEFAPSSLLHRNPQTS